ncbi:WD repeat-containing protein 38-like [Hypanus sabinus]|uniref:WD repeat-containing protein 38-like n=1 Tax=Hypanus sabinus TaxID=79690 RepID=UPI0028C440F0|nr:WD repeat-containing protein 38-like [Hypanus sabinus]
MNFIVPQLTLVEKQRPLSFLSQQGHSKSVETVAFSNDSQVLASAGWDYTVILWEPKLGQLLKKLLGHHNVIKTCAFSHHGEYLATGSWDFKVILWGLQSTRQVILHGHTGNISCVAFSNVGMLASGSWDKTVRVWDPRTGILIFLLEKHSDRLLALSFSLDAILLVTAAEDGTVRVWDCEEGQCKQVLEVTHSCLCFGWITNRNSTGCLEYCTQYFGMLCTFVVTLLKVRYLQSGKGTERFTRMLMKGLSLEYNCLFLSRKVA